MITEEQHAQMMEAGVYWTARAMQEQGSRFYRALGEALEAADAGNRRLIYRTWPDALWDFHGRGQVLAARELEAQELKGQELEGQESKGQDR